MRNGRVLSYATRVPGLAHAPYLTLLPAPTTRHHDGQRRRHRGRLQDLRAARRRRDDERSPEVVGQGPPVHALAPRVDGARDCGRTDDLGLPRLGERGHAPADAGVARRALLRAVDGQVARRPRVGGGARGGRPGALERVGLLPALQVPPRGRRGARRAGRSVADDARRLAQGQGRRALHGRGRVVHRLRRGLPRRRRQRRPRRLAARGLRRRAVVDGGREALVAPGGAARARGRDAARRREPGHDGARRDGLHEGEPGLRRLPRQSDVRDP
mmetsp:Transcript_5208/g.16506  ORF Transcript_5208/g.16506 Transcript_5208/m.16506 type:complete len:272 (-) Transcript_5208:65-880(-)